MELPLRHRKPVQRRDRARPRRVLKAHAEAVACSHRGLADRGELGRIMEWAATGNGWTIRRSRPSSAARAPRKRWADGVLCGFRQGRSRPARQPGRRAECKHPHRERREGHAEGGARLDTADDGDKGTSDSACEIVLLCTSCSLIDPIDKVQSSVACPDDGENGPEAARAWRPVAR